MFSPVDPHVLYYATNVLFKTTNGGQSWETISPDLTRKNPGIPESLGDMDNNDAQADKPRGSITRWVRLLKTSICFGPAPMTA